MAKTQVNPTRMELTRLKKKLVTATRGHKLLKDKRDELMRQFLDLARENMELRKKVEAGILSANRNFVIAKAGMSEETLNTALMAAKQEVYLETGSKNIMSVDIPVFEYKTRTADENDIYSYGFAFTSCDLDDAVKSLAEVLPDVKVSRDGKGLQADGGRDRKDETKGKCFRACHHSRDTEEYQIHHYEAGREREKHTDPPDEGKGYDAGGSTSVQCKAEWF